MSLRQYITEAEIRQHIPEAGDQFDIELEDGTLLETYIIGVRNNAILLDATPDIIGVLREWADLDGEAGEVLFEGQFKQSMHVAAESMSLEDFVKRYGHLFGPGEAEQFWQGINGTNEDHFEDEPVDADAGEYDYEGDMAKDDLETIVRAARRLTGMLDDNENMPEWVQSKINKAADYVDTAADYIESNQDEQGVAEGQGNLAKALDTLRGSWSGWHAVDSYDPNIEKYEWDDGEGGHYAGGSIEHNLKTGQITVDYQDEYGDDVKGTFNSLGDAMRALRGGYPGSHGGRAPNYDRLGQRTPYGPDDLRKTDRTGRKGTVGGGFANARKASIQHSLGRHGPKGVLPEDEMDEAKYQGREVALGKPTRGDVKKFKVYVRDPSTGNIKKVNFGHGGTSAKRAGQKTMKIKKSNPARRKSFRARHNCDNPGPRTKARYWSCRAW